MRMTLKNKIRFAVIGIVALVSLFMFLFFPPRQKKAVLDGFEAEIQSAAETVALGVTMGFESEDLSLVRSAIDFYRTDPRVGFVTFVNEAGTFAAYPAGLDLESVSLSSDNLILKRTPVATKTMTGEVVVGSSADIIRKRMRNIQLTGLAVSLLTLLLGVVGAQWLSNSIVRPVLILRDETRRVSEGHLADPLVKASTDEVGQLTDAFNEVFTKLRKIITQMQTERANIEQRLEETEQAKQSLQNEVHGLATLADQAGRALRDIVIGIEEVRPMMETVASKSEKQHLMGREMNTHAQVFSPYVGREPLRHNGMA